MHKIIQSAINNGQRALSEYESKQLLAEYGIPITREILVHSTDEAVSAAEKIGFPVAVKACSWQLMHKSEAGVIELNLKSGSEVAAAYQRIRSSVSLELEGMLVQEMVSGMRELVFGLTIEPQFGPCVMLGLGGVMTEILNDSVLRVAPFDLLEAKEMTQQLRSRKMLENFRGEESADIEAICRCLVALSAIGLAHPQIQEIDINPMKIDSSGHIKAVDALVVIKGDSYAAVD